jgi:TFIIF-interacting CTD phosphatase-like protein
MLNLFQAMNSKHFFDLRNIFLNISRITEQEIYNYFYTSLSLDDDSININYNNKITLQKEQEEDEKFIENIIFSYKLNKAIPPFLDYKHKKKYTVVLDLEDTLLNIKLTETGKLILNLRPGLISFLTGIKPYYEIISFSKFSKSYSHTIINYIQQGRKVFDVNLYREHCALIGKKFIKDISRIGRDMKRIIMIDDLPANLGKFKSNGILILPYEGEEQSNDRVLYELKKLLILFYKLGYDDIRFALKQYQDDITEKITYGINQ